MTFKEHEERLFKEIERLSTLLSEVPSDDPVTLRDQMARIVANYANAHELYRDAQLEGHQQAKKILNDYLTVIPQWLTTAQSILKSVESERRTNSY